MSIKDKLSKLGIIQEEFFDAYKIREGKKSDYTEVYINPDTSETRSVVKQAKYDGCKIGVDDKENIYVWIDHVMHDNVSRAMKKTFVLRFDYTKGNDTLYTGSGTTEQQFKENITPGVLNRLKKSFPNISKIEQVTRPFNILHTY